AASGQRAVTSGGSAYAASSPPPAGSKPRGALAPNGFITTTTDARSTFALDVDTGSYALTRATLGLDQVPSPDTVRPEEFVNAFDGGYARPSARGFAISVDGAPTPFVQDGDHRLVRIGLATRAIPPRDSKAAVLTWVVDVSGSMDEPGKLPLVKETLGLLLDELRPDDRVAIVVYGDAAREVLASTPVKEASRIRSAIDALQPEGSTNVEAGLRLGYEVARRNRVAGAINRVVLASDGVANVGATDPEAILRSLSEDAGKGITLVTAGYGMGEYRDDMMERLADAGDGFYTYVDTKAEAERVFVRNLTSTLDAQALDAKAQVEWNPDAVERYRLVGYENRAVADESLRDDSVDGGEVGAGHTVTALYEVRLVPGSSADLGTVRVHWVDTETSKPTDLDAPVARSSLAPTFVTAAPRFQLAAVAGAFADVLRASPFASKVTLAAVADESARVARLLGDDADVRELASLAAKARDISARP
ncbi:MAG TPA: von Willebrand factor type A domain-containing protein, partial [Acidimicrobiales bacterium]